MGRFAVPRVDWHTSATRTARSNTNPLRWRKITWLLDVWIGVFALWMINGVINSSSGKCDQVPGFGDQSCGTGYVEISHKTTLIFLVWCLGFIVLSFAWLMTAGRARPPS
jgi:hypothetical protein